MLGLMLGPSSLVRRRFGAGSEFRGILTPLQRPLLLAIVPVITNAETIEGPCVFLQRLTYTYISDVNTQGLGNDFQVEGARALPLENYLPPNSSFSSDFGHFILKVPMPNREKTS